MTITHFLVSTICAQEAYGKKLVAVLGATLPFWSHFNTRLMWLKYKQGCLKSPKCGTNSGKSEGVVLKNLP